MAASNEPKEDTEETKKPEGDCVFPPKIPDKVLNQYTLGRNEEEAKRVTHYVEYECSNNPEEPVERVTYLEKVHSEYVGNQKYDCWNVRTDTHRYWVITPPMNLYYQDTFDSMDYTLSFHVGLTARMEARYKPAQNDRIEDRMAAVFRRLEEAEEVLFKSEESEEIQAVGMRCRECLIVLVRSSANLVTFPEGAEAPKMGDFIHWSELIADKIAAGSRNDEIRAYLKSLARSIWQLVSWLTHASNATRYDGVLAIDATGTLLNAFGSAIVRYERPTPNRCGRCNSLRISVRDDPEFGDVVSCEKCGASAIKLSGNLSETEEQAKKFMNTEKASSPQ